MRTTPSSAPSPWPTRSTSIRTPAPPSKARRTPRRARPWRCSGRPAASCSTSSGGGRVPAGNRRGRPTLTAQGTGCCSARAGSESSTMTTSSRALWGRPPSRRSWSSRRRPCRSCSGRRLPQRPSCRCQAARRWSHSPVNSGGPVFNCEAIGGARPRRWQRRAARRHLRVGTAARREPLQRGPRGRGPTAIATPGRAGPLPLLPPDAHAHCERPAAPGALGPGPGEVARSFFGGRPGAVDGAGERGLLRGA